MENGAVYYAKHQDKYIIKLTGEVRYPLGCSFNGFLTQLFARGDFSDIWIDLTQASVIDSTCLGLLAKIANYIRDRFGRKATVWSTHEDVNKILKGVGFEAIFNICRIDPAQTGTGDPLFTCDADQAPLAKTLYEAHLILSEMNEKNREMFKNVVDQLRDKVTCEENNMDADGRLATEKPS